MSKFAQKVIDKVQAAKRNWKYKEGKYFNTIYFPENVQGLKIQLLKGPFKGILYAYDTFNITEDLGDKGAQASFEIEILNEDLPEKKINELLSDRKLAEITGQILLVILEAAITNMAENYYRENLADEEDRESYFEEPLPKRGVRPKSSPVHEDGLPTREVGKDFIRGNPKVRSKVQQDSDS
jgi:hypothetical protein